MNGVYRGGSISTGLASNTNRSGARRIREKNVSGLSGVGFRLNGVVRGVANSSRAYGGKCSFRWMEWSRKVVYGYIGFRCGGRREWCISRWWNKGWWVR